jgi:hypothetical protein
MSAHAEHCGNIRDELSAIALFLIGYPQECVVKKGLYPDATTLTTEVVAQWGTESSVPVDHVSIPDHSQMVTTWQRCGC